MAVPLKKRADGIITGNDWDHLATDFLGEGRNRWPASYVVYTDGTDTYAFNGVTGIIDYGGPDDNGGVDGANVVAVIQAALNNLTVGRIWKEKMVLKGNFTFAARVVVPSYTAIEIQGRLYESTDLDGFFELLSVHDVEIFGGEIESATQANSVGIRIDGTVGTPTTDVSIHDIKFEEVYYGVQIRDYTSDVNISDIHSVDCSSTIKSLIGCTNVFRVNINNILAERDDGATIYAVNIDAESSYFTVNNIIGYKTGSVAIASARHITVSNAISIEFTEGGNPAFNIETTPGYQNTQDVEVSNVIVYDSGSVGIRVGLVDTVMENIKLSNCFVYSPADHGIRVYNVQGGQFVNCEVLDGASSGWSIFGGTNGLSIGDLQFVNCKGMGNDEHNWYLDGNLVGFMEFHGCIGNGAVNNDGIYIATDIDGARLINCRWEDNNFRGIVIANASVVNVVIKGNVFSGNGIAPILNSGTNTVIENNDGYVTENNGVATMANGTAAIVVAHGLDDTPTVFNWAGEHAEVSALYVSAVGAANFTFNKGTAGNTTGNRDINWEAKVR